VEPQRPEVKSDVGKQVALKVAEKNARGPVRE